LRTLLAGRASDHLERAGHFLGQSKARNRRIRNEIWLSFSAKIFW